ncbi:TfoX/Sxy family DNA transformation protein [Cedecea sp. FDAARGOS_727]|uniref:TfoX/Sxy family DNA transformation protein n=1 Tax=Cedecea sp. FDAARGOS_727 TaxID=2545798 RepID=UPI00143E82CE|nr:TfoX/Sxy family DNA transformation protein [Cedecea sp. FDAARGOS_727]QIX94404.1 TfoX/Sxy family DNA transformation protein [Cedecea sp. FDAARGOS_727]
MKDVTYVRIHKSQECLSPLGDIGFRPLFGGYSLAVEGIIFAMVSEGELYLRACEQCADYFSQKSAPTLMFYKRGLPIELNYYRVDEELWSNHDKLIQLSFQSLSSARRENVQRKFNSHRLKDLPNLSMNIEVMLREVGIGDFNTLRVFGAKRSWLRLRKNKKPVGIKVLLALAGAIQGVHEAVLPLAVREELTEWWRRYEQRQQRYSEQ